MPKLKLIGEKKSEEDEQTLDEFNLVHCCSPAKCHFVEASNIKRMKLLLFVPCNKQLINRAESFCIEES